MSGVSANPPARTERAGQPFLLYRDGDDREQVFSFEPGLLQASVGRERSSDLMLGWDGLVSRLHARFERVGDDWTVVDDGLSRNGTFVNGERLRGRRRLQDGDTVLFGATAMTFRAPPAEEPSDRAAAEVAAAEAAAAQAVVAPVVAAEAPPDVDLSTSQRRVLTALCSPYKAGAPASPASNEKIAEALFLSVTAVRRHLTVLYAKLEVEDLPESQRRARLVERAFQAGLISERDL